MELHVTYCPVLTRMYDGMVKHHFLYLILYYIVPHPSSISSGVSVAPVNNKGIFSQPHLTQGFSLRIALILNSVHESKIHFTVQLGHPRPQFHIYLFSRFDISQSKYDPGPA